MRDDTGMVELTRPEAREIIGALADYRVRASGEDGVRVRDIRDSLAREFEFDEYRGDDDGDALLDFGITEDDSPLDWEGGDAEAVSFSRTEAAAVVDALREQEERTGTDEDASTLERREADTVADIRKTFEDEFGLDADATAGPNRSRG